MEGDSKDTFTHPPFVGYLMLGCGVLFCGAPFLPGASANIPTIRFFFMFTPFWGSAFLAAAFFFRYRVVVTDTALTLGAFRRQAYPFEDIVDWDVVGDRNRELLIYLRDGSKLNVSAMLCDFDGLVGLVNSHMALPPSGQPDSPFKLQDRAARARNARILGWIFYVGLGVVAAAALIAWRFQRP